MNKVEFAKFAMALKECYPNHRDKLLPDDAARDTWYSLLNDIPMSIAEVVLKKWVTTQKWPPTIAELRELAAEIQHGRLPDWGEGWEQVLQAKEEARYTIPKGYIERVRKYLTDTLGCDPTAYLEYQEADPLDELDPITRKAVESIGWERILREDNSAMMMSIFRKTYETIANRETEATQMPALIRDMIDNLGAENVPGGGST
jgi:hypothetical protein